MGIDIESEIESWLEMKQCYEDEIEVGNDIEMNEWLIKNCDKEIKVLLNYKTIYNEKTQ